MYYRLGITYQYKTSSLNSGKKINNILLYICKQDLGIVLEMIMVARVTIRNRNGEWAFFLRNDGYYGWYMEIS